MKNLYDTLEFNKIQEKLNLYIKTEVGKNLVNTLELSTDLSGRYVSFRVQPLTFKEIVEFKNIKKEDLFSNFKIF